MMLVSCEWVDEVDFHGGDDNLALVMNQISMIDVTNCHVNFHHGVNKMNQVMCPKRSCQGVKIIFFCSCMVKGSVRLSGVKFQAKFQVYLGYTCVNGIERKRGMKIKHKQT